MGWRDRDWAKFDDNEWRALLGGSSQPFTATASPGRPRRRSSGPITAVVVVAVLTSFGATVGVDAFHKLTRSPVVTGITPPPANVVRIRWRESDIAPSPAAGRICVDSTGTVCANYAVGEKPADALTRQLQTLGLSVQSAG